MGMNPILKRTLTGLAVGAVVVLAILFLPLAGFLPAVSVLVVLAGMEFSVLYDSRAKMREAHEFALLVRFAGYLLGWAVVACLLALAFVPRHYGDAACGPFRLGNVMLLYVVAIVKFSDVGGFAFGLTSAKLMKGGNRKLCPTISPNKSWVRAASSRRSSGRPATSLSRSSSAGWALRTRPP